MTTVKSFEVFKTAASVLSAAYLLGDNQYYAFYFLSPWLLIKTLLFHWYLTLAGFPISKSRKPKSVV